jgi:hypothetical protein
VEVRSDGGQMVRLRKSIVFLKSEVLLRVIVRPEIAATRNSDSSVLILPTFSEFLLFGFKVFEICS